MQKILSKVLKISAPAIVGFFSLFQTAFAAGDVDRGLRTIRSPFSTSGWLTGAQDVPELIEGIIKLMLFIGGAVAVLFVIIGGYQYMTSGGNSEQAEKGKTTVVNAIIGIVLIVLAWVIINVVVGTISY